jgi:hypothetical protein
MKQKYVILFQKYKEEIIVLFSLIFIFSICVFQYSEIKNKELKIKKEILSKGNWKLVSDTVEATVYNAVPTQCKADVSTTASNFILDLTAPEKHRIIAIERTMMNRYDLHMGDVVKIEGADKYDGLWRIEDKMNARFKNQDKIDFLVDYNTIYGLWKNVKLYKLINKKDNIKLLLNSRIFKPSKNE